MTALTHISAPLAQLTQLMEAYPCYAFVVNEDCTGAKALFRGQWSWEAVAEYLTERRAVEVHPVFGHELVLGAGKNLRDGEGIASYLKPSDGILDIVIYGATIVDAVTAKAAAQILAAEAQNAAALGLMGGGKVSDLSPAEGSTDGAIKPGDVDGAPAPTTTTTAAN